MGREVLTGPNNNNTGGTMTETKIDTGTDELLCVIRDRVAIITLNRPEVRNAMSDTLTPALRTMTIGSVFGRVAGREAARNAKN